MSQTNILLALALIGGLFLVIGVQTSAYAQWENGTSMGANVTNATSWSANATNATSAGNETGNISGLGGQGP
jgi:hypothetical protein